MIPLTDDQLRAVQERQPLIAGPDPQTPWVGLTTAERDALVAEVRRLRETVKVLRSGKHADSCSAWCPFPDVHRCEDHQHSCTCGLIAALPRSGAPDAQE